MFRENGVPNENVKIWFKIILILPENIACNPRNPIKCTFKYLGNVHYRDNDIESDNFLDAEIDYR
jgi:hypothetical protein